MLWRYVKQKIRLLKRSFRNTVLIKMQKKIRLREDQKPPWRSPPWQSSILSTRHTTTQLLLALKDTEENRRSHVLKDKTGVLCKTVIKKLVFSPF